MRTCGAAERRPKPRHFGQACEVRPTPRWRHSLHQSPKRSPSAWPAQENVGPCSQCCLYRHQAYILHARAKQYKYLHACACTHTCMHTYTHVRTQPIARMCTRAPAPTHLICMPWCCLGVAEAVHHLDLQLRDSFLDGSQHFWQLLCILPPSCAAAGCGQVGGVRQLAQEEVLVMHFGADSLFVCTR